MNPVGFFLNLDQGQATDQEVVDMLSDVGYQAIELGVSHLDPRRMSAAQMKELVRTTEAAGLQVSELVVQRELVHRDVAVREAELALTADCIAAAVDLGIDTVNCFTGPAPFRDLGSPTLHRDIGEGEAWGMVCRDYYTLAELLRRYDSPALGVNYDPSHMALHGNSVGWTIEQLAPRIFHCHVKDVVGAPGKVMGDTFLFPLLGEGYVPWPEFFQAITASGYARVLSVEFESFDYFATTLRGDLRAVAEMCYRDFVSLRDAAAAAPATGTLGSADPAS